MPYFKFYRYKQITPSSTNVAKLFQEFILPTNIKNSGTTKFHNSNKCVEISKKIETHLAK